MGVRSIITCRGDSHPIHTQNAQAGHLNIVRLWTDIFFSCQPPLSPHPLECLLDTGAPLSVIPYDVWHLQGLAWDPVHRKNPSAPSGIRDERFQSIPCDLGRIDVWLPHDGNGLDLQGPYRMHAKFARFADPSLPYTIVGMDFFSRHAAELQFRCPCVQFAAAGLFEIN
jgi:hypothetical protein